MKRTMKKRLLQLSLALASATLIAGVAVGCGGVKPGEPVIENIYLKPSDTVYEYSFDKPFAPDEKLDASMKIDGKLSESVWANKNYYSHGEGKESFKIATHFTDNGLYIGAVATDPDIIWTAAYRFPYNSGFQFTIVGIDKQNDPTGGNIEANYSHGGEEMIFHIDTKNVRSDYGVPISVERTVEGDQFTVECFLSWEDMHFTGRQEQIRIDPWYVCGTTASDTASPIVFAGGYNANGAYYGYSVFDENGSISQTGSKKNTSDMTLGNSPFGFGTTDRWDLSKDNSSESIRQATSTTAKSEIVWLKNSSAKNFSFETAVQFTNRSLWNREDRKAGIILGDGDYNLRPFVTYDGSYNFRLGSSLGFTWIAPETSFYTPNSKPLANTLYMRVVKYGANLYYFYKYIGEEYTFMHMEEYSEYTANEALCVGLYASCNAIFTEWNFESYDKNTDALKTALGEYVAFANTSTSGNGAITLSASAVNRGGTLQISAIPRRDNYLSKLEINGQDYTDAYFNGAVEGDWGYKVTEDVNIKATFTQFSSTDVSNQLSKISLTFKDQSGAIIPGANILAYPVNGDGSLNAYSSRYVYEGTTSSNAGLYRFDLPRQGSSLYSAGTYLIKVNSNKHFRFQTIITVPNQATAQQTITVPTALTLKTFTDAMDDIAWTVEGNGNISVQSSVTGDYTSLAYYKDKSFAYGEISANFTIERADVMVGFGFNITSGTNIGRIGLIGVSYKKEGLVAVAYNYLGDYSQISEQFPNHTLSGLISSGDVVENGDGTLTFKLRLIKASEGVFLFIGNQHVYTYKYNRDVLLSAGQEVNLGVMVRTISALSQPSTVRITGLTQPQERSAASATLTGTITNASAGPLSVLLKGTNAYGVYSEENYNATVTGGRYSLTVNDVASSANYTVEFSQGDSALKLENGNPITVTLRAGQTTTRNVTFTEFRREYTQTLHLEGVATPVVKKAKGFSSTTATIENVVEYNGGYYYLDTSASGNVTSGVIPESGTLELIGYYKHGMSFDKTQALQVGFDGSGMTMTFPMEDVWTGKYAFVKEKTNAISMTATITGVMGSNGTRTPELDSGFVVTDGNYYFTFMWNNYSHDRLYVRDRLYGAGSLNAEFGPAIAGFSYNPDTNYSMRLKMTYVDRIFTFYKVQGNTDVLLAQFDLDAYPDYDKAEWSVDTQLSFGFFSWNGSLAGATFSDVVVEYPDTGSYEYVNYLEKEGGGYTQSVETGIAFAGTKITSAESVQAYKAFYLLDKTKTTVTSKTVAKNATTRLESYYKKAMSFSSRANVDLAYEGADLAITLGTNGGYKYLLSADAGYQAEVSATITNTSDGDCGLGFVVGQGAESYLFYLNSYDRNSYGRLNGAWAHNNLAKTTYYADSVTILAKGTPLNAKLTYADGVFTLYSEQNSTMLPQAVFTVEECNATGANFDKSKPFYVGIGGTNDAASYGTFKNVQFNVESAANYVTYTQTVYKPNGELYYTETLAGKIGETVKASGAYEDQATGIVYIPDPDSANSSAVLSADAPVNLVANLTKQGFKYGFTSSAMSSGKIDFSSENGNLVVDTSGAGWYRHIYTEDRSNDFSITAKITSNSRNTDTGISVMNEKGERLTFVLASWNGNVILDRNYNAGFRAYWDNGGFFGSSYEDAKFLWGESITLTLTYKNGTFTMTSPDYPSITKTYTNAEFAGDLYVGFRSWNDGSSAKIEIIDLTMNHVEESAQAIDYLFIGDSWIDNSFWPTFKDDLGQFNVANIGYGGAEVPFWNNLIPNIKRTYNPQNIVIHIGINDIINTNRSNAEIAGSIQTLMTNLKATFPSATISWITISPTNRPSAAAEWNDAKAVNTAVKSFIETNSANGYKCIDFASAFCTAVGQNVDTTTGGSPFASHYNGDGLHLNTATGYVLFSNTIKLALGITTPANYTVETYTPNGSGGYSMSSQVYTSYVGANVSVPNLGALTIVDDAKTNVLSGTVTEGGGLVLKVYYKHVWEYSQNHYITVREDNGNVVYDAPARDDWKFTLSKQSGTNFEITATITQTGTGYNGLGFAIGQGGSGYLIYWSNDANQLWGRVNGAWGSTDRAYGTNGVNCSISQNNPVNVKMTYADGTFTFFMEVGGTMTQFATATVADINGASNLAFNASQPFHVGFGSITDSTSSGTFSNVKVTFNA